ncbi:ATP-grasp domain-containing protein [Vibrio vulnificus]|nr:ATP-grasp domain-containing protein [Vibrio vulnificus]
MVDKAILLIYPIRGGEKYILSALNKGYYVFCLHSKNFGDSYISSEAKEILKSNPNCEALYIDDKAEVLDHIKSSKKQVIAVIPCTEPSIHLADQLSKELGLLGNDPLTSDLRRNKLTMREALIDAGLLSMSVKKCHSLVDALQFQSGKQKIVLKTPEGAGQEQVYICSSESEIKFAFDSIVSNLNLFGKPTSYALAEDYLEGDEIAVNVIVSDHTFKIIDIWEYTKGNNGVCNNILYNMKTVFFDETLTRDIEAYCKRVCSVLGHKVGIAHLELKLNNGRCQLIELGARLPGTKIPHLWERYSERCIVSDIVDVYLGSEISPEYEFTSNLAIVYHPDLKDAVLIESIDGINNLIDTPSYVEHEQSIQIGDLVRPISTLNSSAFVTSLANKSLHQLCEDICLVHNSVQINPGQL